MLLRPRIGGWQGGQGTEPALLSRLRALLSRSVSQLVAKPRARLETSRRKRDLQSLFGSFVGGGDLVFDVGAHAGDYTEIMLQLGARVVAFEPQPEMAEALERRFRRRAAATIVAKGLADAAGHREMAVGDATTVSTMEPEWVSTMSRSGRFGAMSWNRRIAVEVTTLDDAIDRYGRPDFIKIDVEGFEPAVLSGLSQPVPTVCFEFVAERPQAAIQCVERLESLGLTEFNLVDETEAPRLASATWLRADDLLARLTAPARVDAWGDVYARLPGGAR